MSRIGKMPIKLPEGVNVTADKQTITVNGPRGTLQQFTMPDIKIEVKDGEVIVSRGNDEPQTRAKHGLLRSLVNNMVIGVSKGFEKKLEIEGVGYRAQLQGDVLKLNIGFSHDINYKVMEGVTANVDQNVITLSGLSKQKVGQTAAEIRALKKPEPYKGRGIRYQGEHVLRKAGKSGKEKAGE